MENGLDVLRSKVAFLTEAIKRETGLSQDACKGLYHYLSDVNDSICAVADHVTHVIKKGGGK